MKAATYLLTVFGQLKNSSHYRLALRSVLAPVSNYQTPPVSELYLIHTPLPSTLA